VGKQWMYLLVSMWTLKSSSCFSAAW